ncbi:MAG: hypothetical protein K2G55_08245 [Lachnospiraceae bacterium]|nr:hypothetical protein [Lachnospiraceae bacterium]MDE7205048.1 hypothetical protein [Lachnospiraceae bacterium]
MQRWKLGIDGYVMQYMIAGPVIEEYSSGTRASEQLALEAKLRAEIVTPKRKAVNPQIKLGDRGEYGAPWTVYAAYGNCFIEVSSFYSTLQKIRMSAATVLYVPKEEQAVVRIWTYMAAGVYLNGVLVGEVERPVYKPIQYLDVVLLLKAGSNLLYFDCENLGVRDTRDMLAVQVKECGSEIEVALPDEDGQDRIYDEVEFLSKLQLKDGKVIFPRQVPENLSYCSLRESPDYEVMCKAPVWERPGEGTQMEIPEETVCVTMRIQGNGYELSRTLEFSERRKPEYRDQNLPPEENFKAVMEKIASVGSLNRGKYGFAIFNILVRKYLGRECPKDRGRLLGDLELIHKRVDCSDFLLCGLLRYMHHYELDQELAERVRDVLLDYRYWMDMDGADAMCFWSENHALMFYSSAMDVGNFYPEDFFPRAGMNGRELSLFGKQKVLEWIEDVEANGFEEFLSTVYMCVTLAALLNVVDFAEPALSGRARVLTDRLLRQLCLQTFQGSVIAPMGRVYREVIYPFEQGAQSIIHLLNPKTPDVYGEGWLAFLVNSTYRFPKGLAELMEEDTTCTYTSGNALIKLEKNGDYCLTSVQSPREDAFERWANIRGKAGQDAASHAYTRSLNECFHGTTCFQPGVYGYQQHMWYGALSPEAVVFVNHPGTSAEHSGMRPGYWFGNGVMPAIKQIFGMLGAVYDIPNCHPIGFTHIYCPLSRFDETAVDSHWLILKKEGGYLALWSSGEMQPYNDMVFGCEFRVYESSAAYLCVCGRERDYGSLASFADYVRGLSPVYDRELRRLSAGSDFALLYCAGKDETQFVD